MIMIQLDPVRNWFFHHAAFKVQNWILRQLKWTNLVQIVKTNSDVKLITAIKVNIC